MSNTIENMVSLKEFSYLKYIREKFTDEKVNIFDIGTNKGHYINAMFETFGSGINKIHGFEPVPKFYGIVKERYKDNELVELTNAACSDKIGKVEFYEIIAPTNEDAEGLSSLNFRDVYKNFDHEKIEIDCIKLDDFIKENNITNVEFVKIDTEGHELSVLTGAKESLNNGIFDFIQIEYGDCIRESGKDLIDILNLIENTEYNIYDFIDDKFLEITKDNWQDYKYTSWDNFLISKHKLN